jgi:hypothetical protein
MNGVPIPGVSAGSNHVGARVMCAAHVICPAGTSGAAPADGATASTMDRTSSDIERRIAAPLDWLGPAPHDRRVLEEARRHAAGFVRAVCAVGGHRS